MLMSIEFVREEPLSSASYLSIPFEIMKDLLAFIGPVTSM